MIAVTHLTKRYGDKIALSDVSFEIRKGEICGYIGPNGAGKSTTVKILTGMLPPDSGKATVAGVDVSSAPERIKPLIGYVPETGSVFEALSPTEYLSLVGRLHNMEDPLIAERTRLLLDYFNLLPVAHNMMTTFSKGMRQKVVISASLLHAPDIMFFDEPLDGLDAGATVLFKELVHHLALRGKTILYCSHLLDIVERICHRILILSKGSIVAEGSIEDLREMTQQETLEEAFSMLTSSEDVEDKTMKLLDEFELTRTA